MERKQIVFSDYEMEVTICRSEGEKALRRSGAAFKRFDYPIRERRCFHGQSRVRSLPYIVLDPIGNFTDKDVVGMSKYVRWIEKETHTGQRPDGEYDP